MYSGERYRGIRPGSPEPFKFVCAGLIVGCLAAALWLFAPPLTFLAALGGCAAAALFIYALLIRLSRGTVFENIALGLMFAMRIALAIFLVSFIGVEIYVASGSRGSRDADGADYLIVLGTQVNGETPSQMLSTRLSAALEYLERNPGTVAILSGAQGYGEDITEAAAMRRWLAERGIDGERLIEEDRSHDTIQNLRNSYDIINERGGAEKICVLSNDFHLRRAGLISSLEGFDAKLVSAKTPRIDLALCYYTREYFSLAKVLLVYTFG